MSDLAALLDQILGRTCTAGDTVESTAWKHLTESGLDRVGIPEQLGGVGGDVLDAAEVVVRTAQAGLISPLRETLFPAAELARICGHPLPEGVVVLDRNQLDGLAPGPRRRVELWHALGVAAHSLGLVRAAVDQASSYVVLRRQFGRPLADHQVVRHQIATIVSHLCACETAVWQAVQSARATGTDATPDLEIAIASAKIQTAVSSAQVARVAHQVHGAIGMTAEHPLHHFTTQLWALPREAGGPEHWSRRVYTIVQTKHHADLWTALTDPHPS
jgi:acyl-CoA dehydrogenase